MMEGINWLDIANHFGFAMLLYVGIRIDMKHLVKQSEDHETRIRNLEGGRHHGSRRNA